MKFNKSQIFIALSVAFAAGVLAASRLAVNPLPLFLLMAFAILVFALSWQAESFYIPLISMLVFAAGLGAWRLQSTFHPNQFVTMLETKQQLEGYIVEDPDIRLDRQLLTVQPKGFSQKILVTTSLVKDYSYGDWVVVEGKINEPKAFEDFDYQKYLERYDVYGLMRYPKVLVLKTHRLNWFKDSLLTIKHAFSSRVAELLPEPQGSLLLGILIGAKKSLPQDVTENFNATGTSHIIAVSGYNITIIISSLGFLVYLLGRRLNFAVSAFIILGFVILTGGSASVVRAAVMGAMLLVAGNIGRQYSVVPTLIFAALVMIIINPRILFWDIGFQLSFLGTLGIVELCPLMEKFTEKWPEWLVWLKPSLFATLAATAATLPVILLQFGRLSVVAPLANILILPTVPYTMLIGFLSIIPFVGPGFAYAANILLSYTLWITRTLATVPGSSFTVKIEEGVFIVICFIILAGYLWVKRKGRVRKELIINN